MWPGRLGVVARSVIRSRLFLGTALFLGVLLAGVSAAPNESVKLVLALFGIACTVPLWTAVLVRHLLRRNESELQALRGAASALDGRIGPLEEALRAVAERQESIAEATDQLLTRLEDNRQSDYDRLSSQILAHFRSIGEVRDATGEVRDSISATRDEIREQDRALSAKLDNAHDSHTDQLAQLDRTVGGLERTLRSLVVERMDQYAVIKDVLRRSSSAVLVHAGVPDEAELASRLALTESVAVVGLDGPAASPISPDTVVVVAGTLTDLRWLARRFHPLPDARRVLVVVLRSARSLLLPVLALQGHTGSVVNSTFFRGRAYGWTYDVSFSRPTAIADVVLSLARLTGVRAAAQAQPDVETDHRRFGLDLRTVNPVGFDSSPDLGIGTLTMAAVDQLLTIRLGADEVVQVPPSGRITEADIAAVRRMRAVAVDWGDDQGARVPSDAGWATVLSLAMAGVPLTSSVVPPAVRRTLGPDLADLISSASKEAIEDSLSREEYSVRLRRVALRQCGSTSSATEARGRLSVILCTRRSDFVAAAVEQVGGQRGVDIELLLGLHGIDVDEELIRRIATKLGLVCSMVHVPAEVPFGTALNRLASAASGSLLVKMDDDDWYGPDFLGDLVLARGYSNADVVGCVPEFVYLEELDTTVRRPWHTEVFNQLVSGGAMMIDRTTFDAVGGFRAVTTGEDKIVQEDIVAAGGVLYRTHGLGYVIRRRRTGHTWDVDTDYFVNTACRSWPGLHLTALFDR